MISQKRFRVCGMLLLLVSSYQCNTGIVKVAIEVAMISAVCRAAWTAAHYLNDLQRSEYDACAAARVVAWHMPAVDATIQLGKYKVGFNIGTSPVERFDRFIVECIDKANTL